MIKGASIDQFISLLEKDGYTLETINAYNKAVRRYLKNDGKINLSAAEKFFADNNIKNSAMRSGIKKYIQFSSGEEIPPKRVYTYRKKITEANECNHDCFNCVFDDCIMP